MTSAPPAAYLSFRRTRLAPVPDTRGRLLRDLRISVTDRCNFRCTYCMPKSVFDKDYHFLPTSELLSFEEITRMTQLFVAHGVKPLLRKNLEVLIEMLAALKTHDGKPLDMALTTNASLLSKKAQALKAAGLQRVTVSLDEAIFRAMNDVDFPVADVLNGIDAAHDAGFASIKINMVVKKGVNDQDIVAMARHFKGSGHIVRFKVEIEDESTGKKVEKEFERKVLRRVKLSGAGGTDHRVSVLMKLCVGDTIYEEQFTLADRDRFNYPLLIGRRTIEHLGYIDVSRTFTMNPTCDEDSELLDHEELEEKSKAGL